MLKNYLVSFQVWAKHIAAVLVGGSGAALSAHFVDPTNMAFDSHGIHQMAKVGLGGAVIALFHLWLPSPKPDPDNKGQ